MNYEVYSYNDLGFKVLMSYDDWRVAVLNYIDDCHIDHLKYVEAHHETDEVFVLLEGDAYLIFIEISLDKIVKIETIKLEKHKVYNIKKGVYHTQVLSEDAKLLIVEAKNTGDDNSIKYDLSPADLKMIKEAL